jgi:N,N'-diacetyllegionaminate synthase
MRKQAFIIAEIGVNHNGQTEMAKALIDAAIRAGADAVKFQTFKAKNLVSAEAPKAEYQKKYTDPKESQLQMLAKLELSEIQHRELLAFCKSKKIQFLSSPFDLESIDLLVQLGLGIFKIPSGEITNLPYLRKIGGLRKEVLLSTGMANLQEIDQAVHVLTKAGTSKERITLLHCHSEYPTHPADVNLLAIQKLKEHFQVGVGYSDHTPGIEFAVAAVAIGAQVLEKHLTLDKNLPGPDHKASLDSNEFEQMVKAIRNIEKGLGNGIKEPSGVELKNRVLARKSIVAARDIKKGEVFSVENLTAKRPATGLSPMLWENVINKKARQDFKKDDLIKI